MSEASSENQPESGHGQLSLWDTVSIIVGIVIGSSIFETAPAIFENVYSPWQALGVWLFCGVLSFIGALCYAELATTYPRSGGDYVYLTRGLDRPMGFLFGWSQLSVILSGSTGAMAFIFGKYCAGLFHIAESQIDVFAIQVGIGAVVVLTLMNFFGVVLGKWVQNALVIVKMIGLLLIVVAGLILFRSDAFHVPGGTRPPDYGGISVAIILVLYAFGGWNDAAFVAADLKERRNITTALLLGTLGITVVYLLVNLAYLLGLGFATARGAYPNIAARLLQDAFGNSGSIIISILVMISALGAMNGLIFTGSRVYQSLGKEHRVFGLLGQWNETFHSPIWALLAQACVTVLMMLAVGTVTARDSIDSVLALSTHVGLDLKIDWGFYRGGFFTLFAGTAPVFWIFFLMTGFSMFALRARDPNIERPFILRAPWYPFLPMIFCGMCLFGFYAAMRYAGWVSLLGFIPLFLGLPLYWLSGTEPVPEGPAPLPPELQGADTIPLNPPPANDAIQRRD
ncbi:MAG: amino acid permease [Planctomycetes bacterium]|nr:amino acid permease [Planctomycetota bacterium]